MRAYASRIMTAIGVLLVIATASRLYFDWTETAFIFGAVLMAVGMTSMGREEEECTEE